MLFDEARRKVWAWEKADITDSTWVCLITGDWNASRHGEATAVLQDIASYEQTQESLALLKMLAQSSKSIQEERSKTLKKAYADVRKQVRKDTE